MCNATGEKCNAIWMVVSKEVHTTCVQYNIDARDRRRTSTFAYHDWILTSYEEENKIKRQRRHYIFKKSKLNIIFSRKISSELIGNVAPSRFLEGVKLLLFSILYLMIFYIYTLCSLLFNGAINYYCIIYYYWCRKLEIAYFDERATNNSGILSIMKGASYLVFKIFH